MTTSSTMEIELHRTGSLVTSPNGYNNQMSSATMRGSPLMQRTNLFYEQQRFATDDNEELQSDEHWSEVIIKDDNIELEESEETALSSTAVSPHSMDFHHLLSNFTSSILHNQFSWMDATAEAASSPQTPSNAMRRKKLKQARNATKYLGLDYASYLLKKLRRRTFAVYALIVAEALSIFFVEPFFMSLVLTEGDDTVRQLSAFQQELLIGMFLIALPLGQALSASVLGHASDMFGRKPILLLSVTASYMIIVCLGLARSRGNDRATGLYMIWFLRFAQGLCGSVSSIVKASLTDIGRQDTQFHTISLVAYATAASALARIVLSICHAIFRPIISMPLFSSYDPFVLSSVAAAILMSPYVILVFTMKDSNSDRRRADNLVMVDQDLQLSGNFGYGTSIRHTMKNRQFLLLCALSSMTTVAITLSIREMMYHASSPVVRYGLEMNGWGVVSLTVLVCSGIMFWQLVAFKKLTEWYDLKRLYLISVALISLSVLMGSILAVPYWINGMKTGKTSHFFVWVLVLVYSVPTIAAFTLLMPTLNAMIHLVTQKSQGIVYGTEHSINSICQVFALLFSSVMFYVGVKLSFVWLSSIVSLGILLSSFALGFLSLSSQRPHIHHVHLEVGAEEDDDFSQFAKSMSDYDRYRYGMGSTSSQAPSYISQPIREPSSIS